MTVKPKRVFVQIVFELFFIRHLAEFENHLRAILDLSFGSTQVVGHVGMVKFIGGLPDSREVLKIENTHLHLYDKAPPAKDAK